MTNYNLRFIRKEDVAKGTTAFYFEKPTDFIYKAGQNADLTLINPPQTDSEGDVRTFSFITAPYEAELGFATRMRSTAFKNVIKEFKPGDELQLAGPYGDFTLPKDESVPIVFLIGGIGVTPVLSMIKEASHNKSGHNLTLFHADHSEVDAPFRKEFLELEKVNPNFKYIEVLGESTETGENIVSGRMSAEILKKYITDINKYKYYLSGPEGMVKAMREMLVSLDISEDSIRTEEFSGY